MSTRLWLVQVLIFLANSRAFLTPFFKNGARQTGAVGLDLRVVSRVAARFATGESLSPKRRGDKESDKYWETDYMGLINFCLRSTDGALTGPSRSKVLNELTNDVFKAIVIGSEEGVKQVLSAMDKYRETVLQSPCYTDLGESLDVQRPVVLLESGRGVSGSIDGEKVDVSCNIDGGRKDAESAMVYILWLERLLQTGEVTDNEVTGGIYLRGYKGIMTALGGAGCLFSPGKRPTPIERNICLSLVDLSSSAPSRTKELNALSNSVSRAMLYGGKKEKDFLSDVIKGSAEAFTKKWCRGDSGTQEVMYLKAIAMLLRKGLAATEKQISGLEMEKSSRILGESDLQGGVGSVEMKSPSLRLFDAYTNAFQRVVELCLAEISARSDKVPQNEDVILNFVQWEQSLRRNLTAEIWKQNPTELAGTWELIDIAGQGSLQPIMINSQDIYFGMTQGLMVELTMDGKVDIRFPGVEGLNWFFKPGPAHLDTCEFFIRSNADSDLLLNYVGFIDRGQRIESR